VTISPPVAAAQGLVTEGACRDGEPNGAYMLRSGARLRVAGAFAKGLRTGTFVFWDERGARIAVIPYDNERKGGTIALWYAPPGSGGDAPRKSEATYVDDRLHGDKRSWHENGSPRTDLRYEQGELVAARAWTRSGTALAAVAARELAARDQVADERFYATLELLVADHRPHCE
jgi:antitoxin component YwqK of YwqJK toxin-antitoxin module